MKRSLAAGAVLSLAFLPFALTQNSATPTADVLVLEQPGNQWYEGPLTHVTISLDGNRAVFFSGLGHTQLYSLATGRADPETLRDGLDHLDAAGFCGPGGFIRLGTRGTESGIFFQGREAAELSSFGRHTRLLA